MRLFKRYWRYGLLAIVCLGIGAALAGGSSDPNTSANQTVTDTAIVTASAQTQTVTAPAQTVTTPATSKAASGSGSKSVKDRVITGGGTENLPPIIIRHAGWLRWRCASCGSANFIVQDDNDAISINALNQTAGRTYVQPGKVTGVQVITEGSSWKLYVP
jgi:hypothetical protein